MQASKPIVVIGGGVHGTAHAYMLARKLRAMNSQQKVILFEQYESPNDKGSSHGDTRLIRFTSPEARFNTQAAMATMHEFSTLQQMFWHAGAPDGVKKISDELRARYGGHDNLFHQNGFIMMAPKGDFKRTAHSVKNVVQAAIDSVQGTNVVHEVMDGVEAQERFPAYKIDDPQNTVVYHEPEAGTLFPERCVFALRRMGELYGVEYRPGMKMNHFDEKQDGVNVTFADGSVVEAEKMVVCAGAWANRHLPRSMGEFFLIQRQVVGWFKSDTPELLSADHTPNHVIFQHTPDGDVNFQYGCAISPFGKPAFKTAFENGTYISDPESEALRPCYPEELQRVFNFATGIVNGLHLEGASGQTCRYTVAPGARLIAAPFPTGLSKTYRHGEEGFVRSLLSAQPIDVKTRVVFVSACSGHGFQKSAGIAARVAEDMLGLEPTYKNIDLANYSWNEAGEPMLPSPELEALIIAQGKKEKTAQTPGGFRIS